MTKIFYHEKTNFSSRCNQQIRTRFFEVRKNRKGGVSCPVLEMLRINFFDKTVIKKRCKSEVLKSDE